MDYAIAPETLAAIRKSVSLGLGSLRAEAPMALSDWAAQHFKLAGESSHQKGGWIAWSFQIGILDFMSDERIEARRDEVQACGLDEDDRRLHCVARLRPLR